MTRRLTAMAGRGLTELQGVWLTCGSHALLMPHSMLDVAHLRPGLLARSLGGVTAPSGRRPCVLEGAEKAPFGMRRDGVLNTLYTNRPFDAESST